MIEKMRSWLEVRATTALGLGNSMLAASGANDQHFHQDI